MNRSLRGLAVVWLILMVVLAEEIGAVFLVPGRIAPGVALGSGIVMAVVVGFAFMRLRSAASARTGIRGGCAVLAAGAAGARQHGPDDADRLSRADHALSPDPVHSAA